MAIYKQELFGGGASTNQTPTNQVPSSQSSGGNYYYDLTNYYKKLYEDAKNQELANIQDRLNNNINIYNQNMATNDANYDKLINQNESGRFRTMRALREAQANRGQLDTGLSRSEQLYMDSKYGNQLNDLLMAKENARADIRNKIADANINANEQKANVISQYAKKVENF